jgi:signal transduction histidine kinase
VRGRALGAFVLARTTAIFTDDEVELCQGIAGQLAIAIERAQLDRYREEETQVMAAIARVGQELISCLDTPALVERLCRVTTEVLRCDFCETRFWDPARDAFVLMSAYGLTSEEHEALRPISIPRSMLPLEANDVWHGRVDDIQSAELSGLRRQYGVTGLVRIPLRRGQELIGIQTAAYRNREARFSGPQLQIARAIGQLAAMALENARLVEELQRASRLKSEFVATMSHELRTPLNVIIGYSDLLIEESFGPLSVEQRQVCRRVERSAEELLELINATLDLGRLETGRLPVDLQEASLSGIATLVDAETRELCAKPNVKFTWLVSSDLPPIRTDPLKVRVILKNLIANAIKFTAAGEVEVTICQQGSGIELSVRDTGIGIAPETQAIIFEPFRQADGSMSRRFGGVGLGLYIVRRLVDVLGGTVTVVSELGRGSTFRVYLPANGPQ